MSEKFTESQIMRLTYKYERFYEFRDANFAAYQAGIRLGMQQKFMDRFNTTSKKRWSQSEVDKLIDMRKDGKTYQQIANALGREKNGVAQKMLNIRKEKRKKARVAAKKLLSMPLMATSV